MTQLEQLLQRAQNAEIRLSAICGEIAAFVQKKIDWDNDISCEYQPSDGFVIVCADPDDGDSMNVPVSYFVDTWKDHQNYTLEDIRYLR